MRSTLLRGACSVVALLAILSFVAVSHAPTAPANVTVPYSAIPVADGDLDGNPATGAWSDAASVEVPLENGAAAPYGAATWHAKHDGTYAYFRLDGKLDVPWTGVSGPHAWLGLLFSAAADGHHKAGQDGVFFGDSTYTTTAPLVPVDTNGGGKPPAVDASQDDLGEMRVTGSAAPYDFTAEWKRALATGDADDLPFVADGTAPYYLYVTTDSDGGGSGGGTLGHNAVTNDNVIRFEVPGVPPGPPPSIRIDHSPPDGVAPGSQAYVRAVLTNATSALVTWRNTSMAAEATVPMTNLTMPEGTGWVYAAWLPAQPMPTQVRYAINASNADGSVRTSYFFTVAPPAAAGLTPAQQTEWVLTLAASAAMTASAAAVLAMYVGRRVRRGAT